MVSVLSAVRRTKQGGHVSLVVALIRNVVADLVFVEAHDGDEVPACPECSLREFLCFLLEPHGRLSFQDLHEVGDRVLGWNGEEKVNVLVADVPLVDVTLLPLGNVLELSFQFLFDVRVLQYCSAVLGTPDHMVVTDPRAVGLLVESSVHGSVTLVSNIDHRDFLKDFVFKRTPQLKLGVYGCK